MKYIGWDLVERECEGPHDFILETVARHEYSVDYLNIQPPMVINSDSNPFSIAMKLVASCPPFLRKSDCPWVLSYLENLRDFYDKSYLNISGVTDVGSRRHRTLLDKVTSFAFENDVISTTRMMYVLDIVYAIFFIGRVQRHDYFTSNDDASWVRKQYTINFNPEDNDYPDAFNSLIVGYDKQFKTTMTRNVYKGTSVMVTIPEGEELSTSTMHGRAMILTSGAVFECTVVRFYKTDLCWANRATFEFYPRIKMEIRDRLQDEPMFAVEMNMARETQDKLWGATINAFIPLHWITHVFHEGEYRDVGAFPTAQKTDSKLPVPMTAAEFSHFQGFGR